MWIVIGFAALGLLIGNLVGLTSESTVSSLISLLFVFVGGSILALLHKLSAKDRVIAGASVLSLSVCCLIGIYVGILVNQHHWLSPLNIKGTPVTTRQMDDRFYLRAAPVGRAHEIDQEKQQGRVKADDAYERMYGLAQYYEHLLYEGAK
jgi:hypothetical protein